MSEMVRKQIYITRRQQAWEKAYQFMLSLSDRADQFHAPYWWNREEPYEERLSRLFAREKPDPDSEYQL